VNRSRTFDTGDSGARKLIGIGLNYRAHADDLGQRYPDAPVFFVKGEHTLAPSGGVIELPGQSARVTAEAELGLVIGRPCRNVAEEDALDHVAGIVALLDQTAEDILQRNPRFLVWSKNYPTFLVIDRDIVPIDRAREVGGDDLGRLVIRTIHNDALHRQLPVSDMVFSPAQIVARLSETMPLREGDLICTGTPGAVVIEDGDEVACEVEGLAGAHASVRRSTPVG
jgi:2-keto-4-pentenoate hydratase/2-oxohepta-3-ene-1,7-dioic acid hydratase in catechol pathway